MSGLSKVIVLDPDVRASRQVQLGFEREGVPTATAPIPADAAKLELFPSGVSEASLVIVGGTVEARALELIGRVRALLEAAHIDVPIVFAGRGVRRTDAEAAGADEVVLQPAHLRDVVTIGRLLRGLAAHQRAHIVGSLAETTGVFTLVRALSALGRSAVLTLMRGLRRGEVRFYHGEVTSAQVGLIHGQAALHQLLLWTDARFDFHHEDIVRRQQIPMAHDELFADAERFLAIVRDESGSLSPSMVLEQDVARVHSLGKQIPTEVHGVLRMFDGHRVLADVLEDSPYRVFETLRVAQRACDAGLLRQASTVRPKATWRAVLAIEEWLVGSNPRAGVQDRAPSESGPLKAQPDATGPRIKASRRKRKKRRVNTPLPIPAIQTKPEIDWGALVPRTLGAEVGPLAGVVPASHTSGEIVMATRDEPREKLEALMDTDKRERIFPRDIGIEPSVVWNESDELEREQRERAEAEARERAEAKVRERAEEEAAARLRAAAEREAAVRAEEAEQVRVEAEARAAGEREVAARHDAEQARLRDEAAADARRESESKAAAEAGSSRDSADDLARRLAEARSSNETSAAEKARVDADARAAAEMKARGEAGAKAASDAKVAAEARDAEAAAKAAEHARLDVESKARAKAAAEAADTKAAEQARTEATAKAAEQARTEATAKAAEQARQGAEAKAQADAAAEQARQGAEAKAQADATAAAEATAKASEQARLDAAARASAEADAKAAAGVEAAFRAEAEARARLDAEQQARLDGEATKRAEAEARRLQLVRDAKAAADKAEADVRAAAAQAKADAVTGTSRGDTKRTRAAKRGAKRRDLAEANAIAKARAAAEARVAAAHAVVTEVGDTDRTLPRVLVEPPAVEPPARIDHTQLHERTPATTNDGSPVTTSDLVKRLLADERPAGTATLDTPSVIVAETASAVVMVADRLTVTTTDHTARLIATSIATVTEPSAAPSELHDEPSDGIVRERLASVETAPAPRRSLPQGEIPFDDRPDDATGEITTPISIEELEAAAEPTILVADLAAVHSAVSAIAIAQVAAPHTPNASTPASERAVVEVLNDASVAFTEIEEDFFRAGTEKTQPPPRLESFDDLDEGYQPVGFWDRLRGKKPIKPGR